MPNPSGPPTALDSLLVGGVPVFGGAGSYFSTGQFYFVDSVNGSAGGDGTAAAPLASVAGAMVKIVSSARATRGDTIICMPGHAETVSSATGLAMSVAGVTVIGLGMGSSRPTITLDTANTATIAVSAANVRFVNMVFKANFLSIAACFTLTTAKWFTVQGCFFADTSSVLNFLNIIKSTGAANTIDGLTVTDNDVSLLGTTSVNATILSANDIDSATVVRNNVKMARTADASILMVITAGVLTNLDCGWNRVYSAQTATTAGSLINVGGTTSTGFVYNNYAQTLTTTGDKLFTTTVGLAAFENRVTGVVGATGFTIPAVDS